MIDQDPSKLTEEQLLDLQIEQEHAARDAANAPRIAEDKLARKRVELADIRAIAKAEQEIGPVDTGAIATVKTRLGVVIIRPPKRVDYRKLTETTNPTNATLEEYCTRCLVYPTPAEFVGWAKEQPAILSGIATECSRLAGYREDLITKK